jgi:hypothetical protein
VWIRVARIPQRRSICTLSPEDDQPWDKSRHGVIQLAIFSIAAMDEHICRPVQGKSVSVRMGIKCSTPCGEAHVHPVYLKGQLREKVLAYSNPSRTEIKNTNFFHFVPL